MTASFPKFHRLDKPARIDCAGLADSPVGFLLAGWEKDLLVHLSVLPAGAEKDTDLLSEPKWAHAVRDDAKARDLVKTGLFPDRQWRGKFSDILQLGFYGSDFQFAVMQHMLHTPSGGTTSYAALSKAALKPGAARAVGSVCARNPICLVVPCHRVLTSQGGLGGYAYGTALKSQLLRWEQQAGQMAAA